MNENSNRKNKNEILKEYKNRLGNTSPDVSDLVRGEYESEILVRCVEDLEKSAGKITNSIGKFRRSIEKIGDKSDKLSGRLFWLNIILAMATVIAAAATVILAIPILKELF